MVANSALYSGRVYVTFILVGAQDITLERIEPDQLPCPEQSVTFQCQIMVPSAQLAWTVPNRDDLEFNINRDVGYVRNSPDNVYSANLTGKIEADLDGDRFFFNSTLLVLEPVNGSNLTCKGGTVSDPVEMRTTIALSGENVMCSYC